MQPTVPAWVSWYRRLRPGEVTRGRSRPPARVAVYASVFDSRNEQNLHLIRLDDMLGNSKHIVPTPPSEWLKRLNLNDMWRAHISPELTRQAMEYQQRFHSYPPVSIMLPPSNPSGVTMGIAGPGGAGTGLKSRGAWGGWAAGALLLALLVLVLRAAERCLDRKLFKARRRQSEEWPTPSVMATSLQQHNIEVGSLPPLDDSEFSLPSQCSADLPPPYSECASKSDSEGDKTPSTTSSGEEPPPPYSAVAFVNKDVPTVHLQRRHIDQPQTSTEADNVENNRIETQLRDELNDGALRVELVFDNGRVVERTIDVEHAADLPDIVANVGDTVIGGSIEDTYTFHNIMEHQRQERFIVV